MDTPPLPTILDALADATARTSARAVARATQLTPTRVIQLVDEHREGNQPRIFRPTYRKLCGWYQRQGAGAQPQKPKLSRHERSKLRKLTEQLQELLEPDLTVLVGPHLVSAKDITVAIRRLT